MPMHCTQPQICRGLQVSWKRTSDPRTRSCIRHFQKSGYIQLCQFGQSIGARHKRYGAGGLKPVHRLEFIPGILREVSCCANGLESFHPSPAGGAAVVSVSPDISSLPGVRPGRRKERGMEKRRDGV